MDLSFSRILFMVMVSAAGWLMASLPLVMLIQSIVAAVKQLGV